MKSKLVVCNFKTSDGRSSLITIESDIVSLVGFLFKQIQLAEHEYELIEMNSNSEKLRKSYNELLEFKIVLEKVFSWIFL